MNTDETTLIWLKARFEEVEEAFKAECEMDKLESLHMLKQTVDRVFIAIEARLAIRDKAYEPKYQPPWYKNQEEDSENDD